MPDLADADDVEVAAVHKLSGGETRMEAREELLYGQKKPNA